jgi:hypothetical protein
MAQKTDWDDDPLTEADINTYLMGEGGAWTSYTPTFSGTLGNGSVAGKYARYGRTIIFKAAVTWGSTTSHAAAVQTLSLPATAASQEGPGSVNINQGGTGRRFHIAFVTTTAVSGQSEVGGEITNTLPVTTWANGHTWSVAGVYEAAS